MIEYTKTISLPVLTTKTGEKLCKIKDFIIDSDSGKFLGIFCVKLGFIFTTKFFIRIENIENFGQNAVMVEDGSVLENPYQNERVSRIIKSKISIKNNKVLTESGDDLGEVKNYEVDVEAAKMAKIIVSGGIFRDFFRGELIIPSVQIVSIGRDAIIVRDAVVKEAEGAAEKITPKKEFVPSAGVFIKR